MTNALKEAIDIPVIDSSSSEEDNDIEVLSSSSDAESEESFHERQYSNYT